MKLSARTVFYVLIAITVTVAQICPTTHWSSIYECSCVNGHLGVTCIDNNQQNNRKRINMQGHPLKITSPIIVADIKIMGMNGFYDSRYLELVYSRGSPHTTRKLIHTNNNNLISIVAADSTKQQNAG